MGDGVVAASIVQLGIDEQIVIVANGDGLQIFCFSNVWELGDGDGRWRYNDFNSSIGNKLAYGSGTVGCRWRRQNEIWFWPKKWIFFHSLSRTIHKTNWFWLIWPVQNQFDWFCTGLFPHWFHSYFQFEPKIVSQSNKLNWPVRSYNHVYCIFCYIKMLHSLSHSILFFFLIFYLHTKVTTWAAIYNLFFETLGPLSHYNFQRTKQAH